MLRSLLHRRIGLSSLAAVCAGLAACSGADAPDEEVVVEGSESSADAAMLTIGAGEAFEADPREPHLRNVRQLTFEGENAEAYFSYGGTQLIYQRTPQEGGCDQIFSLDLASGEQQLVSTGTGRTTCSYFYPDDERVIFASTHAESEMCPAPPDMSRGYVWAVYPSYDLWVADADGSNLEQLTDTPGYDAEATLSPRGDRMIFTSMRDGDLDLYTMNLDGTDVQRITDRIGYDGGAFYSPDGSKIVWRAHYPEEGAEMEDYQALLAAGLIRPSTLEVYIADADGSNVQQVTDNGAANFGPFFHPSGEKIIYSSNQDDPTGRNFDLYMINIDGTGNERITFTDDFDGFPMFSPDGRYLVWGSNRNPSHEANTNVFIAEWVEN